METKESQGIRGLLCTEEIKPHEVICSVPNKLILSAATAHNSEIAEVFRNHDDLFVANPSRDEFVLRLFVMYERNKGAESFWHEWFEIAQLVDLPYTWDDSKIEQIADVELQSRLRFDKALMEKDWASLQGVIKLYTPKLFGENQDGVPMCENLGLYHWACNFVTSRGFATDMPHIWACPLIDLVNHAPHAETHVDVIHTKLHLAKNKIYMHEPHFPNLLKRARLAAASSAATASED